MEPDTTTTVRRVTRSAASESQSRSDVDNRSSRVGLATAALFLTFAVYATIVVIPTGTILVDEVWAADIANQLLHEKVLYRDVSAPYGPVTFELYALCFRIFGKSFFALRMVGLFIILAQGALLLATTRLLIGPRRLALAAPAILFVGLGMIQGDRISASTLAGLFTLAALYLHCSYLVGGGVLRIVGAGAFLGISALTKHNVAAFDVMAHGLVALTVVLWPGLRRKTFENGGGGRRSKWAYVGAFPAGGLLVVAPYLLAVSDHVHLFIQDTLLLNVGSYSGATGIAFPSPADILRAHPVVRVHYLSFYSPLLMLAPVIRVLWSRAPLPFFDRRIYLLCGLVAVTQLLQMTPIADYSHHSRATIALPVFFTVTLAALLGVSSRVGVGCLLVGLCLHLAPAIQDQAPQIAWRMHAAPSRLPHTEGLVSVDSRLLNFDKVLAAIEKLGIERFLVIGHAGQLSFFLDREHVTRQSSVSPYYVFTDEAQREVIQDVEKRRVRLVIVAPELRSNTGIDKLPLLRDFVQRNFRHAREIDGYHLWVRKGRGN